MASGLSQDGGSQDTSSVMVSRRIVGRGEMADRVRKHDWASSPLGPIETWSKELLTIVNLTLASPTPARTMWGPEMTLIYNDAYRPIPGPRHPAALGKPAKEVYRESWSVVGPLLENALATGETLFYERMRIPLPTERGMQDHYLNYSFNPIFEEGKIAGLFGQIRDVTDEVDADRKLRHSEARLVRIMQSIGDAVIVTDAETLVTRMNPIAEELTGWTIENARGKSLADVFNIVNETTREKVESPAEKVKRLGTIVGLANHTILIRSDGTEINIDDSGSPIREDDGTLSGIVLIFRDIGEKRRLEKEREKLLLEVRSRYAELEATYNNAGIAMALIDALEFRYLRVNHKLCEILGLPEETIVGSKVSDVASQVPGLQEALQKVAAGEVVVGGLLEGELSTSPGMKRYWTMDYAPVFGNDGKVVAIAAASAEITRQKQAEAVLMKTEKLAAVGRLASSIAHEINNPLASVTNLLYLIGCSELPAEVREYLKIAERELHRVSAIANQTLRFHKQTTHPNEISFDKLINEVLAIFHGRLVNTRIRVETRMRSRRPLLCFEGEIRQVVSNLIGNAIDAMHPEGGRLLLRSREETDLRSGKKALVITVADTGCGMSPQTVRNLFEPFFTTKGFSGTGLGLWISQEIISRHGGSIRVRSSQRKGACGTIFAMSLPLEAVVRVDQRVSAFAEQLSADYSVRKHS
ncbi:MAG TPA: PAS domain S-box protein [Terracidiphilus sp.]